MKIVKSDNRSKMIVLYTSLQDLGSRKYKTVKHWRWAKGQAAIESAAAVLIKKEEVAQLFSRDFQLY